MAPARKHTVSQAKNRMRKAVDEIVDIAIWSTFASSLDKARSSVSTTAGEVRYRCRRLAIVHDEPRVRPQQRAQMTAPNPRSGYQRHVRSTCHVIKLVCIIGHQQTSPSARVSRSVSC